MSGCDRACHLRNSHAYRPNLKFRSTSTDMKKRIDVQETLAQIRTRIGRRGIAAAVVLLLALLAAVATPQILGHRVAEALGTLREADPKWLWLAGVGVATSVLAAAACWRTVIEICGGGGGVTPPSAPPAAGPPPP